MTMDQLKYQIKKSIKNIDPNANIYLFGSKARGDDSQTSDWDFLILTSIEATEETKKRIRASLIDAELESEQVISTIIHSKASWDNYQNTYLFKNIKKDGIEI
jgi:predicted nucleotidyltransferase